MTSAFRTLRVVRLLRAGRLLISIPEIYILMSGLASALKPILFGSIMLLSVIILWAIIVVEFLHPTNSQRLGTASDLRDPLLVGNWHQLMISGGGELRNDSD